LKRISHFEAFNKVNNQNGRHVRDYSLIQFLSKDIVISWETTMNNKINYLIKDSSVINEYNFEDKIEKILIFNTVQNKMLI
jgi:hypothetical protein